MQLPNLVFKPHPTSHKMGVQAIYKGWSIVCGPGTYGGRQGLYEVMGPGFDKDYGVEGSLTLFEVMIRIAVLEKEG